MSDPRCGTPYGYVLHVANGTPKCTDCRRAHAAANRSYEVRRYLNRGPLMVDATGTRRRIQALGRIGWSTAEIGRHFGVSGAAVRQWAVRPQVKRTTAARIAALYDLWWDKPGPNVGSRRYAIARGWPPPLAFDDDEIDDPAATPMGVRTGNEPTHMNRDPDVEERVMSLTRAGLSAAQIAVRLRVSQRQVVRIRTRNRQEDVA